MSLTAKEVDDGAEVGPLLDQVTGVVASSLPGTSTVESPSPSCNG